MSITRYRLHILDFTFKKKRKMTHQEASGWLDTHLPKQLSNKNIMLQIYIDFRKKNEDGSNIWIACIMSKREQTPEELENDIEVHWSHARSSEANWNPFK